ncbi:RimK family protein [Paraneptunicella aestuarii]|uniref:RimK family protein n=1 Tax=Paraneptunicella aestuarii TaxID=2831148 RepID=UPI001E3B05D1|nr:RimK family protein [Paraneptunicella aestuarii]UAA40370.1 RimK family protein [Paraneptunicella aestuarii]
MAKTIIVADKASRFSDDQIEVISFEQYLAEYPKLNEPKMRVINLCDTSKYLSHGYYCSLLAEARRHKVLPSISTINDLTNKEDSGEVEGFRMTLSKSLFKPKTYDSSVSLLVYFGWTQEPAYLKLGRTIFEKFPAPVLRVNVSWKSGRPEAEVFSVNISELNELQTDLLQERLDFFVSSVWRTQGNRKQYRWEMAILVNPEEKTPPSDKRALQNFVKAAEKLNIHAELVSASDIGMLSRYDALFIRETTSIKHHTYKLARKAEMEGLVVIDDPTSILRCCNKVFLHDAFTYNRIPSPKTCFVSDIDEQTISRLEQDYSFPMVLKLPESSFSMGVFKVDNRNELQDKLTAMLKHSALVLVQEYLYTQFDWRIGVLNGRAIYACRYHMARNHWQIYNHAGTKSKSGAFETLPTFEVPRKVLDVAVKSCGFVGKGLYGVDLKQVGDKIYVIEVNDNPSIEHEVEDQYLGKELYMQIMQEFVNRLEARGR